MLLFLFSEVRVLSSGRADHLREQRSQVQCPSGWHAVRGTGCDGPVRACTARPDRSGKQTLTDLEDDC